VLRRTEEAPPIVEQDAEPVAVDAPAAPAPPSMEELLARFHQAAKAYEERTGLQLQEQPSPDEEPQEPA
jgi:hypothetical protein